MRIVAADAVEDHVAHHDVGDVDRVIAAAIIERGLYANLLSKEIDPRRERDLLWRNADAHVDGRVPGEEDLVLVRILAVRQDAVVILVFPADRRNLPVAADR